MHTVELLDEAVRVAASLGYQVRQEWLDGGGGGCEFGGRRWIFIDLGSSVPEQFEQVARVLRNDPSWQTAEMSQALHRTLSPRRAA
jgi:hypothetical protein